MAGQNVLFIMSDEHSRHVLGAYGNRVVRTPNLDRLAAEGTLFENAYANCPICVPSRASFATGRYVHEIGYWDNAFPYTGTPPSLGHRLHEHGHRCELDRQAALPGQRRSERLRQGDPAAARAGRQRRRPGHAAPGPAQARQHRAARGRCRRRASRPTSPTTGRSATPRSRGSAPAARERTTSPGACSCPSSARTSRWSRRPSSSRSTRSRACRCRGCARRTSSRTIRSCASCARSRTTRTISRTRPTSASRSPPITAWSRFLDDNIGQVLSALDASGLREDTLVVYTSDHGDNLGTRTFWGKSNMYEEAAGVPLILRGQGVPRGRRLRTPVSLVDGYPTILDAVGVPPIGGGARPARPLAAGPRPGRAARAHRVQRVPRRRLDHRHLHGALRPLEIRPLRGLPAAALRSRGRSRRDAGSRARAGHEAALAEGLRRLRAICDPAAVTAPGVRRPGAAGRGARRRRGRAPDGQLPLHPRARRSAADLAVRARPTRGRRSRALDRVGPRRERCPHRRGRSGSGPPRAAAAGARGSA